jgi:hypothetical protein
LVEQHDQLYEQLVAGNKNAETQRQAVLTQLLQLFDGYVKQSYTVLVNNFANTDLIEVLTPGQVFFIIPQF